MVTARAGASLETATLTPASKKLGLPKHNPWRGPSVAAFAIFQLGHLDLVIAPAPYVQCAFVKT